MTSTSSGVENLLSNLNASKAAGPDQLSGKLLKATACESAQILQVIFQRSLDTGELPAKKGTDNSSVQKGKQK